MNACGSGKDPDLDSKRYISDTGEIPFANTGVEITDYREHYRIIFGECGKDLIK
jgi:hypothetical protein